MKKYLFILLSAVLLISTGCSKSGFSPYKNWDKCVHSSNWHGSNANMRMMNMLSPHMSDGSYKDRLNFIKSRKCDTVHVFLTNKKDGEYAGYSIYGNKFDWNIDKNYSNKMLSRVKSLSKDFYVVLWIISDDSSDWAKTMASNPTRYISDVASLGFFDYAAIVVTGLEANEYWSGAQASAMYNAVKSKYKGKVGIHQTSNSTSLIGACDIFFAQMNPGSSESQIKSFTKKCVSYGKPVNMFELERQENRQKSQWALDAGAYAIGNW